MLSELVSADNADAEEIVRNELFPTLPGVTTCTHFSVPAMLLGLWLFGRGDRRVLWPLLVIFVFAVVRALLWRERSAVIALVVPGLVMWLRTWLCRPLTAFARAGLQLGPALGIVMLLLFFGAFEYVRSWQFYERDFASYSEFTLWRVSGYYTTAHNNGAMALQTQAPLPMPFWTLRPFWKFPGLDQTSFAYDELTGVNPAVAHLDMLERYGTLELNNEGGLFMPIVDFGVAGFIAFWFGCGILAGRLYRCFLAGTLAGLTLYPIIFLAILETPLILYVFFPASFPALASLVFVVWRAGRVARVPAAARPIPMIA